MVKTDYRNIENINDINELYNNFRIIFFDYIVNELGEENLSPKIMEYYDDYNFNAIRLLVDNMVDYVADICMINVCNHVFDEVDNAKYRAYKTLDDMFTLFYERYFDLLEENNK